MEFAVTMYINLGTRFNYTIFFNTKFVRLN